MTKLAPERCVAVKAATATSQRWDDFDNLVCICLHRTAVLARDADPAWFIEDVTRIRLGEVIG